MAVSALAVLGGGQAIGGISNAVVQHNAIKMQGEFQRQTLEQNIRIANIQADEAIKKGEREIVNYKKGVNKLIGSQRAAFAGQNVELDSGSALDVQEDTAQLAKLNMLTMRNNAWLESWGYKAQAVDMGGKLAFGKIASETAATTTLLTGIGQSLALGAKTAYGGGSGGGGLDGGGTRSPSSFGDLNP